MGVFRFGTSLLQSTQNMKDELNRKELKKLVKLADMGTVKTISNEFTNLIKSGKMKAKVTFVVEIDGLQNIHKLVSDLNADV